MDLRLFVAIELPEAWTDALADLQHRLRGALPSLRWTRPEGIHLTLKFLGNVPSDRVSPIIAAVASAAATCEPFTLRLGTLGAFSSGERPRVIWAGVAGDLAALTRLWRAVDAQLTPLGFAPERGSFAPHLTLARVPDGRQRDMAATLPAVLAGTPLPPLAPAPVTAIALMRSELGAGGSRYTQLASGNLRNPATKTGKDPDPKPEPPMI